MGAAHVAVALADCNLPTLGVVVDKRWRQKRPISRVGGSGSIMVARPVLLFADRAMNVCGWGGAVRQDQTRAARVWGRFSSKPVLD